LKFETRNVEIRINVTGSNAWGREGEERRQVANDSPVLDVLLVE